MSKILKILKNGVPLAIGIYLIYFSFKNASVDDRIQIYNSIKQADLRFVCLSLLFGTLSHLSRAYRWNYLLKPLGYSPSFLIRILTTMISYFANLGIPRSGEILRATALRTYARVPFDKGFGTIVIERIIDIIILLLFIGFGFICQYDLVFEIIGPISFSYIDLLFFLGSIGVLIFFVKILNLTQKKWANKILVFFNGFLSGMVSIKKLDKKWSFIAHTIFIWTMYFAMFWIVTFAIPETRGLPISAILSAFIAGGLAMSATNGGIGLYPIAVAAVIQVFNIPYPEALAFGWVIWTGQTVIVIFFGSLSFLLLPICSKK